MIGQSSKDAGSALSEPYGINNLLATIFESVFDVGQLRLRQDLPVDLIRLITGGQPIPGLC